MRVRLHWVMVLVFGASLCGCVAEEKESRTAIVLPDYAAYQHEVLPVANTPAEGLKQLVEGNARYVHEEPRMQYLPAHLRQAAKPFAAVVALCPLTVKPDVLFDQPPGSLPQVAGGGALLVERLEAAVRQGVKVIVVLAQDSCQASTAAASPALPVRQQVEAKSRLLASLMGRNRCLVVGALVHRGTKRLQLLQEGPY